MKFWTCLVALVLCIGLVSTAQAAKGGKKGLRGKISAVTDDGTITVSTGPKQGAQETAVKTDDKTMVTVDGTDAKVKDLKVGLFVMVTPAEGTATMITATSTRPERKNKPDAGSTPATKPADAAK